MAKTLRPSKAPNQPIAPVDYDQRFQDQFSNALRLYFNEIDNFTGTLMQNSGGRFINFPHIAAQDNADQYASGNNTPTIVQWDTLDTSSGFTLNVDNTATATYSGTYKIDYSIQLANTSNAIHDAFVWLRVDGVDVAGSGSKFSVNARKSAGNPSFLVAYSSVTFSILAGQSVGLWWATDLAATSGGTLGIYLEYEAAQTSPFARPSIPSVIGSIVFVSELDQ